MLQTLLPLVLPNLPPALIKIANDVMITPGVLTPDGVNFELVGELLPKALMQSPAAAQAAIGVVLRGVGVQPNAATLVGDFIFAGKEHDEASVKAFSSEFALLNRPPDQQKTLVLPYGCKTCRRVHYEPHEVRIGHHGKPLCIRCNRTINLT